MKNELQKILLGKHILVNDTPNGDVLKTAYYNAYLLSNFGILVDKPELLTENHLRELDDFFQLRVPASFYSNPQDTKYYTRDELFVNQVVSYWLAYGEEDSRVFVFKHDVPEYPVGEDIKVRRFNIVSEAAAKEVLAQIAKDYCAYKRPWSEDEYAEFETLYDNGFYAGDEILCGDNALVLFDKDLKFARFVYKKDLVKLAVNKLGEKSSFDIPADLKVMLVATLPLAKDCPMSKKQAKYYNTLVKKCGIKSLVKEQTNANSPYKKATALLNEGKVLEAAKVYAANGSLFERNLKMLLAHANPAEALQILDLIPAKNPIVLYQMVSAILDDKGGARTFTFVKNHLVKRHTETDYETTWRKSKLNDSTRKLVYNRVIEKIAEAYQAQPKLGKVYVSEAFKKVGVPINTSATGKGLDVLPAGSRIPVRGNAIRTFVTWKNAFDIDSSLIIIKEDGTMDRMYFGNYFSRSAGRDNRGYDIYFSGDITSPTGTEYYDIELDKLRAKGVKYIVQSFWGYNSRLDRGEIYCGYQDKTNLNTQVWDPKNMELKIHVHGDTRAYMSFGLDLETKEVVIFNMFLEEEDRVVKTELAETIKKYLSPSFLALNIYDVAVNRATEVVADPADADVVFDDEFTEDVVDGGKPTIKVIRSYDIETLAGLATGAELK